MTHFEIKIKDDSGTSYDFNARYTFACSNLEDVVFHLDAILRTAGFVFDSIDIKKKSIHEDEDLPHLDFDVQFDGE